MSHPQEKGIEVTPTERSTPTAFLRAGVFAALRAFFRAQGSGAPSSAPPAAPAQLPAGRLASRPALALLPIALTIALFLSAAPALAAGPPVIEEAPNAYPVSATVYTITANVFPNGLNTEYRFEYATSEAGPWAPVSGGSGSIPGSVNNGPPILGEFLEAEVTGLSPETRYYDRIVATNADGEVVSAVTSTTTESLCPNAVNVGDADITETSAHLNTLIKPHLETEYRFEYATSEAGPWAPVSGGSGTLAASETSQTAESELTGLGRSTAYYVRVKAKNEGCEVTSRVIASFETLGSPTPTAFAVHALDGEAVRVLGAVVPHGFDTHYHFQYVTQRHFDAEGFANPAETPVRDAGSGGESGAEPRIFGEDLAGLEAGVTYHFRLVASNTSAGDPVIDSPEQTLTVPQPPGPQPASCPNEAFRVGPSASLPDCRAYEQVTPSAKSATDLFANEGTIDQLTPAYDGERVALRTLAQLGPNPGSESSPAASEATIGYVISRGADGWHLASVYPPGSGQTGYATQLFAPDLSQVGVMTSDFTTFFEHTGGLGLLSGPAGGPYATLAEPALNDTFTRKAESPGSRLVGADSDFSHIVFRSIDHGLSPATAGSVEYAPELYEVANGKLSLLNVTTGGALVNACGAQLGAGESLGGFWAHNAVSADGSKVFFTAPPAYQTFQIAPLASGPSCAEPSRLYMRTNGQTTEVSAPEAGVSSGPSFVSYQGASADGSKVFFTTATELTHDDEGIHTTQLYEYDTETATLTRISHGDSGTAGATVNGDLEGNQVAISEDGSAVYFKAQGSLTPEAPSPGTGEDLYRYDTLTGETTYIATVLGGEPKGVNEATPDGRFLLFDSKQVSGLPSTGGEDQLYRYDSTARSLSCVSCGEGGEATNGHVVMPSNDGNGAAITTTDQVPQVRAISDDGSYVFFATTAALVPKDTNEAEDVYEWHDGAISLLSGGRNPHGSEFLGEAANGRDVFFSSHDRLSPWDTDAQGDAYDARSGGGFPPPLPAVAPCEGDACAHPAPAPDDPTPASESFHGAGNLHEAAAKPRKHHKKRHRKAKRRRATGHNRGGAR